ncbi:MAG: outer membrane protein assembly factor BamD, partial [Verrucomicrobiales bacterium]|nr:outer membrane protein assembly factor BamD [Verrucomicrobiales bacterium]
RIANAAKDGAKVKVFFLNRGFDTSRIVQMFEFVIANAPQGPMAAKSQFAIGETYMADDDVALGVAAYQKVVDEFPKSPEASRAQLAIADANVSEIKDGTNDAGALQDAKEALDDYKLLTSGDQIDSSLFEKVDFVDEASADQNYKIARFYEKQGKYKAAAIYYAEVIRNGASEQTTDAKLRLAAIAAADPNAVKVEAGGADITSADLVAEASSDVKNSPGYLGPPAPPSRKRPQMRATQNTPSFPFEEPQLPEAGVVEPGLDLTKPIDGEELLLPPPPSEATEQPVPEAEEEAPIELPPPPPPPSEDGGS